MAPLPSLLWSEAILRLSERTDLVGCVKIECRVPGRPIFGLWRVRDCLLKKVSRGFGDGETIGLVEAVSFGCGGLSPRKVI